MPSKNTEITDTSIDNVLTLLQAWRNMAVTEADSVAITAIFDVICALIERDSQHQHDVKAMIAHRDRAYSKGYRDAISNAEVYMGQMDGRHDEDATTIADQGELLKVLQTMFSAEEWADIVENARWYAQLVGAA